MMDITGIAAGGQYSYGLKLAGTVWFWGSDGMGSVTGGISVADRSSPKL
jgi:alpha-tubulin suppressor-like RCC1 family protein